MLCAASLSVSTVQQPAGSAPAHIVSVAAQPVNENGPQCAHCGWRGGSHACVLRSLRILTLTNNSPVPTVPSSNFLRPARAMLAFFSPIFRFSPLSVLP
ncbi:hypothetical protein FB451DRAFT_1411748 [Mycena latifolia]|nr:hypothetical protein FB451DRAFT_1411748 [Mycena latifolia]